MNKKNPIVTITMQNGDKITLELYPEIAPNTVNNFISLINKEFYNGLKFHRVIHGFMLQGETQKELVWEALVIPLRVNLLITTSRTILNTQPVLYPWLGSQHPNSAGSHFFIMHKDSPHLDCSYAGFGKVIDGMDVVNKICQTETDYSDEPLEPQIMKTVVVETFASNILNLKSAKHYLKDSL